MANNQKSSAGWVLVVVIAVAWFWWKNQAPNTNDTDSALKDRMMLYYQNNIVPGSFSKKNAEKLVQIALRFPDPEETFDRVIDRFAKYGQGNYVINELNSSNKEYTERERALCIAQGEVELANFYGVLETQNNSSAEERDRDSGSTPANTSAIVSSDTPSQNSEVETATPDSSQEAPQGILKGGHVTIAFGTKLNFYDNYYCTIGDSDTGTVWDVLDYNNSTHKVYVLYHDVTTGAPRALNCPDTAVHVVP